MPSKTAPKRKDVRIGLLFTHEGSRVARLAPPPMVLRRRSSNAVVLVRLKGTVRAYLKKNKEGRAGEIAKFSGLKLGSINQVLFALKKAGTVTQDKKRGSPFVLAKGLLRIATGR